MKVGVSGMQLKILSIKLGDFDLSVKYVIT